jgi:hypothetical protein
MGTKSRSSEGKKATGRSPGTSAAKGQATVAQFLAGLPAERRNEAERVRSLVLEYLPQGYEEVVSKNTLVYQVPLERYPDTYNGQPLWYVALSNAKSYLSLHLMRVYGDAKQTKRLEEAFRAADKKLDMGKACVHFRSADDLPLEVIGTLIASTSVDEWVAIAQSARRR